MSEGERIAKWLAHAGVASRRDVERMITEGRVKLNNVPVTHPATFVAAGDIVVVDNVAVEPAGRARLWRYHKPAGLVTTHRDPEGRPTVFERLPPELPRVVSVGRLDLNSEGLLLLTNDGGLARRLELPSNGWLRRYRVRVFGNPPPSLLASLAKGVTVDGVRYGPIEAGLDAVKGGNAWLTVALREGRNREVRRVMAHLGLSVSRLIRIAYGPFQLGKLPPREVEEVPPKVLREQIPPERPGGQGMRIVAGAWRGRRLAAPAGAATRPTADRVRQALFDMLWHAPWAGRAAVEGAEVLDAFAGTGALGLEALSRGAAAATFIERDRAALAALRANIAACRAEAQARVLEGDATRPPPGRPCDLIFLDPPYGAGLVARAAAALAAAGWIAPGGLILAELGREEAPPPLGEVLAERAHGAARLAVWRAEGGSTAAPPVLSGGTAPG